MSETSDQPKNRKPSKRKALSHDLLHGLSPEEFNAQAKDLADIEAMTPAVRKRLKAQLIERLKTPVDEPSWGPDWVRRGDRALAKTSKSSKKKEPGPLSRLFGRKRAEDNTADAPKPVSQEEMDDAAIIARNMEKSRQVSHYKPLYFGAAVLAMCVLGIAMFVDYHIIREVWTRALSNEFMEVPPSLQSSVVFKSLQVVFAVLIIHFMLKITGAYGRNTMIAVSFVLALVMIGGLGYLVAYNNMAGGTSTATEQQHQTQSPNAIDQLFASNGNVQQASLSSQSAPATANADTSGDPFKIPKLSQTFLANADSWFWLAFASVVFFIVTTVAALYMQTAENNVRNFHIAHDYKHRQKQFAQLHLLELADQKDN